MLEVLRQEYVTTARAKGLPEGRVVGRHGLSNALVPILTVLGIVAGSLLGGAVVVEQVFSLPGIGAFTNGASQNGDIPSLLGVTVVSIIFVVIVNFLLDLALGALNPKARVQ